MITCPTLADLERFLLEESGGVERNRVASHLDHCPACLRALEGLTEDAETASWRRLHALASQRRLAEACSAASESLLAEHPELGYLLRLADTPPVPAEDAAITAEDQLPTIPGYEILEILGRGGMGVVYKVRDTRLNRVVALKMILDGAASQREQRERFLLEARAIASLKHANIVQIHEIGEVDGKPFFSLDYEPGGSLTQRLDGTPWPAAQAAALVQVLVLAVASAHRQQIIHRDLKPGNILFAADGTPKITDFGLAKRLDAESEQTKSGMIVGTPSYLAPEQADKTRRELGPATDVYSLGVILYELLTGRPPFKADTSFDTILQVLHDEPVPLVRLQPKVPRDLETICLKCLAKEPHKRYETAGSLADDLQRFLAGKPILARRVSVWERGVKWCKRHPGWAGLLAVSIMAVCVVLIIVLMYNAQLQGQNQLLEAAKTGLEQSNTQLVSTQQNLQTSNVNLQKALHETQESQRKTEVALQQSLSAQQREGIDNAWQWLQQHRSVEADAALGRVPPSRRGWEWQRLQHLNTLQPQPFQALGWHDWGIVALASSRDGRLVTSGLDGRVLQWHSDPFKPTVLEEGIFSSVDLRWQRIDSRRKEDLGNRDCFVRLCWLDTERLLGVSLSGVARIWDLRTGQHSEILSHDRSLYAAAVSTDGDSLLFGDNRGLVLLHSRKANKVERLQLKPTAVLDAVYLPFGGWVVCQEEGTVSLLDPSASKVLRQLTLSGPAWRLDLAPDGTSLAVASSVLAVYQIDKESSSLQLLESYTLPDHAGDRPKAFQTVRFSPDGKRLLAGDDLGRGTIWDRASRQALFVGPEQRLGMIRPTEVPQLPLPLQRRIADISFTANGEDWLTAGLDTTIKRWTSTNSPGVSELRVGESPVIQFDLSDANLLWVGDAGGTLALWHTHTATRLDEVRNAHRGCVRGVEVVSTQKKSTLVATCGADRTIRFWKRSENRIAPVEPPIKHEVDLRAIALAPGGERIVALDEAGSITQWDVHSGQVLQRRKLPPDPERLLLTGRLAYSGDGKRLVAFGPDQACWLLCGESLAILRRFEHAIGGKGGTAIAWDPLDSRRVVVADDVGRVYHPPTEAPSLLVTGFKGNFNDEPVGGLAFSPDGSRLAAASVTGTVLIYDPKWVGAVWRFSAPRGGVCGLTFDPTGKRLAFAHKEGRVTICESGPEPPPALAPSTEWKECWYVSGSEVRDVRGLRAAAAAVDQQGRLAFLFPRLTKGSAGPGPQGAYEVVLLRETKRNFTLESLGMEQELSDNNVAELARSLAVLFQEDELFATVRWPKAAAKDKAGRILLYRRRVTRNAEEVPWQIEDVRQKPENQGFFMHLLPGANGKPDMIHFFHAGHYLWATTWAEAKWQSLRLGRQGDGLFMQAAGYAGGLDAVFFPKRFNAEFAPAVCLSATGSFFREQRYEVLDPEFRVTSDPQLAVAKDGSLIAAYMRQDRERNRVFVVARRGKKASEPSAPQPGWNRQEVCSWAMGQPSNLTCDKEGVVRFAYTDLDHRRVYLATGRKLGTSWTHELIWEDQDKEDSFQADTHNRRLHLITLIDHRGQLTIVVARQSLAHGWLRVLRPDNSK